MRSIQTELRDQRHCRVTFDPTVPQGYAKQQKPVLHPSQPDKNMTGNYQFIQRMKTSQEKIESPSQLKHFLNAHMTIFYAKVNMSHVFILFTIKRLIEC